MKTAVRLLPIVMCGWIGVVGAAPTSTTNALTRVFTSGNEMCDTLCSTNWSDGLEAHAGADYLVAKGDVMRLPQTDYVFAGNSLQLGTASTRATLAQKNGRVTFANDGLFLRNVNWIHWASDKVAEVAGRVTVLAPRSAPALFEGSNAGETGILFSGPWCGAADAGVAVHAVEVAYDHYRLALYGDLSAYQGRVRVYSRAILELGSVSMPGEVLVSADGGGGWLCVRDAATTATIGALTLEANAKLAPPMRRLGGVATCGIVRVAQSLAVQGRTLVACPPAVAYMGDTERTMRVPFLVVEPGAAGRLDAADFALTNTWGVAEVPGLRLEVETNAVTGARSLVFAIPPQAAVSTAVRYEDFGAVGDGVADDQAAIVAAHAAANVCGVPVRARDGAIYRIGGGDLTAEIRTDVDFGTAQFIIDDTAVANRGAHIFHVAPDASWFQLGGVTRLARGQTRLGVAPGRPCLVQVADDTVRQFIREGGNQNDGNAKQEVLLVGADGAIDPSTRPVWDYDKLTSVRAYPMDEVPLTVKGGVFTTLANHAEPVYSYFARGFSVTRSNTRFEGVRHEVVGEGEQGAPYGGFVNVQLCAHVVLTGCVFTAHKIYKTIGSAGTSVSMGTYDINIGSASHVSCLDCRQTTDILDTAYWGVYTSNFARNLLLDGCVFSRFDAHQGVANATVRNSTLGHQGINAIGFGTFLVENTTNYGGNFFYLRSDYGSFWRGEFIVRNCRFVPSRGSAATGTLVGGSFTGFHDFGYDCTMPWRITVDGLVIDDTHHPSGYKGPYLFANITSANTSSAFDPDYSYGVTERVTLRNVTTVTGQPVRLSSNTWMFRMVAITDELPRDLMFTVEEPTATADGYAARVVAHVTACDASVLSNACLVATVRDVSGAVVARVAQAVAGVGDVEIPVALPAGGTHYAITVEGCDGDRTLPFASAAETRAFFAGRSGNGTALFSASAERGVSVLTNGSWSVPPRLDAGAGTYRVDAAARFDVTSEAVVPDGATCVEALFAPDDLMLPKAFPAPVGAGALVPSLEGDAPRWFGAQAASDGGAEWIPLYGHVPAVGAVQTVRMEVDFGTCAPHVRYSVKGADAASFTVLRDARGRTWLPSADTTARGIHEVGFAGQGSFRRMEGRVRCAARAGLVLHLR